MVHDGGRVCAAAQAEAARRQRRQSLNTNDLEYQRWYRDRALGTIAGIGCTARNDGTVPVTWVEFSLIYRTNFSRAPNIRATVSMYLVCTGEQYRCTV